MSPTSRYELAVHTPLVFGTMGWGSTPSTAPEQVVITFEGRQFIWHANSQPNEHTGKPDWPTVTAMLTADGEAGVVALATNRLLSALSWAYGVEVEPLHSVVVGFKEPTGSPVARATGLHWGASRLVHPPTKIVVEDDDRLRLALGLAREGRASGSPFYRFLAYWNALDAAVDGAGSMSDVIDASASRYESVFGRSSPPEGWSSYLYESSRNAVAHAVRHPGRPVLDPDAPGDRARLDGDCRVLETVLVMQVERRWPYGVWAR